MVEPVIKHLERQKSFLKTLVKTLSIIVLLLVSACTTTEIIIADSVLFQDKNQRADEIIELNDWTIKGKIAFISPNEKQSANIYWQQQDDNITLKLTTFLGVNVLSLTSENNIYTLKSDGKTWQDDNIENLLRQVSGINFPVQALSFWIKGLKASNDDIINYSTSTDLPQKLQAEVDGKYWHIDYKKYQLIDNYRLATSFKIKQNLLTIKLLINTWDLH